MGQANHEPSMEDILASIKRIIAEDSEAVGARQPRMRREAMAAVATSPVIGRVPPPEPESVAQDEPEPDPAPAVEPAVDEVPEPEPEIAPVEPGETETDTIEAAPEAAAEIAPEAAAPPPPEDVLELTSPMPEAATAPAPAAAAPEPAPAAAFSAGLDGLLSTATASASRNAFAALTQLQVRNEDGQSNTLEGLVSDLLRPMLREWLDRELPGIVERLVAAEIQKVSGRG